MGMSGQLSFVGDNQAPVPPAAAVTGTDFFSPTPGRSAFVPPAGVPDDVSSSLDEQAVETVLARGEAVPTDLGGSATCT